MQLIMQAISPKIEKLAPILIWSVFYTSTEINKFPELRTAYRQKVEIKHEERTKFRRDEWNLANLVIANSEFTKNSYKTSGLDVSKVAVVPYGAPPPRIDGALGGTTIDQPMRFLWAGTFSIRKGAHYLLEAWKQLNPANASLQILGAMSLPKKLLENIPESINISGTVPRSQLYEIYHQSDIFVFNNHLPFFILPWK